ncbi:MAG: glycosyltransferase family 2 protein [Flavobacteriales bacterium]|nr:glycosyltransferase family 2 protein [Flavobacteriales bacterium]
MQKLLISIVMPVKNTSLFLRECLDSILKQTTTNWELLAVDDGSTDNSLEILKKYSNKDNRIKIFINNGNGIIDALRLAYVNSSGELITRMDSDDRMSEDKLSVLSANLLDAGKGNIAVGLVNYFSENGVGEGFKNYENWLNGLILKGNNFKEIYKECVIPSPCWMVYREDLERCDAFNPSRYPEDYDLTFRFYLNGLKPIPCDKVLHHWRDYPTRTSRTDEHYADNTFIEIKTHYFLTHEYNAEKNLVVWRAGGKGKALAQLLIEQNIEFQWICDNPKKIGKDIYDQKILSFNELDNINGAQSIVTVANPKAQLEIKKYFEDRNQVLMRDFFFFC